MLWVVLPVQDTLVFMSGTLGTKQAKKEMLSLRFKSFVERQVGIFAGKDGKIGYFGFMKKHLNRSFGKIKSTSLL